MFWNIFLREVDNETHHHNDYIIDDVNGWAGWPHARRRRVTCYFEF